MAYMEEVRVYESVTVFFYLSSGRATSARSFVRIFASLARHRVADNISILGSESYPKAMAEHKGVGEIAYLLSL
ncbi:hypothetical protein CCACVL1_02256 [Corchorus capsularis]|uniref:Uncharacterized protein n=1 Tax=Corchorus capsularis TaxID=210143 RepID=A0A1R3K4H3_COCAP|nr:hypothetical protein CCACVL1_02955 [Corchorus capsularis]OMP03805.1 hypothetical protein CCACVL1_02256 [Corchorus capsularis]